MYLYLKVLEMPKQHAFFFWYFLKIQKVPSLRVSRNVHLTTLEAINNLEKKSKDLTILNHYNTGTSNLFCEVEK